MGKSVTPKYHTFAYFRKPDGSIGKMDFGWKGRVSEAKAEDARKTWNKSFNLGGVNFHLSESYGYVIHLHKLQVRRNISSGPVIVEVNAPMFEVS